jgi:hypothetical protein
MKGIHVLAGAILLCAAVMATILLQGSRTDSRLEKVESGLSGMKRPKWEYKVVYLRDLGISHKIDIHNSWFLDFPALEKQLRVLGTDGWEMVAIYNLGGAWGNRHVSVNHDEPVDEKGRPKSDDPSLAVFKRRKIDQ